MIPSLESSDFPVEHRRDVTLELPPVYNKHSGVCTSVTTFPRSHPVPGVCVLGYIQLQDLLAALNPHLESCAPTAIRLLDSKLVFSLIGGDRKDQLTLPSSLKLNRYQAHSACLPRLPEVGLVSWERVGLIPGRLVFISLGNLMCQIQSAFTEGLLLF